MQTGKEIRLSLCFSRAVPTGRKHHYHRRRFGILARAASRAHEAWRYGRASEAAPRTDASAAGSFEPPRLSFLRALGATTTEGDAQGETASGPERGRVGLKPSRGRVSHRGRRLWAHREE